MSYANGIITAPVSISDVQHVLGVSNTDLAALCTHQNINKWAKYKPVNFAQLFTTNFPNWWKGDNGKCGLYIKPYSSVIDVANNPSNWDYQRIGGGSQAPYRLTDFNGYNNSATSFTKINYIPSQIDGDQVTVLAVSRIFYSYDEVEKNLSIWDIFQSPKYCVSLVRDMTDIIATNDDEGYMTDGLNTAHINLSTISAGTYTLVEYIKAPDGNFYPIINGNHNLIIQISPLVISFEDFRGSINNNTIEFMGEIKLTNDKTLSKYITGCKWSIVRIDNTQDILEAYTYGNMDVLNSNNNGNVNVPGKSYQTIDPDATYNGSNDGKFYVLFVCNEYPIQYAQITDID